MNVGELCLGLEIVMVFYALEIGGQFLVQRFNIAQLDRNYHDLDPSFHEFARDLKKDKTRWAVFFFGLAIIYLSFIFSDYIIAYPEERANFLYFSYLGFLLLMILMVTAFEHKLIRWIIVIYVFVYLGLFFAPVEIRSMFSFSAFLFAGFSVISYVRKHLKQLKGLIDMKAYFIMFSSGFLLLGVGFTFTVDFMVVSVFDTLWSRVAGDSIQILGMFLISVAVFNLPIDYHFDWAKLMKYFCVVDKSGLPIYSRALSPELSEKLEIEKEKDELLKSAALRTIKYYLETLGSDKGQFETIEKGNDVFIMEEGKQGALLIISSRVDSSALRNKAKYFIRSLEKELNNEAKLGHEHIIENLANEIFFR